MAIKRIQRSTWLKRIEATAAPAKRLEGDSPGGVASRLGCSRQFVHSLIKRGLLEAIAVMDGDELAFYVIPEASIESYLAKREAFLQARDAMRVNQ